MTEVAAVFSHMGGLDEIAIFVVPAAAIILFLRRAERRAEERERGGEAASDVEGRHADR